MLGTKRNKSDKEDSVLKKVNDLNLVEIETNLGLNFIVNSLSEKEKASIVFGKIAFYCEII